MLLMTKLLVTCTIAHIEKSRSIVKMRQNMSIKITILILLGGFSILLFFRTKNLAELSFFSLSLFPVENYYFTKIWLQMLNFFWCILLVWSEGFVHTLADYKIDNLRIDCSVSMGSYLFRLTTKSLLSRYYTIPKIIYSVMN